MKTVTIRVSVEAARYINAYAERRGETASWVVDNMVNMVDAEQQKKQYQRAIKMKSSKST